MEAQTSAKSRTIVPSYNHQSFETQRRVLRFLLKNIGFRFLARVERVEGLENVPTHGPALLMINHIAFIDPIVVLHLLPRDIVPLAKNEVYEYPLVGIFPKLWGVIPVKRDELDRRAVQQVLEVLKMGEMVLVAPEGTRSPALQEAKVGIAYLASRSGAPVLPVAIEGTPGLPTLIGLPRWREPGALVRFGKPFYFKPELSRAGHEDLRKMTDEAMYQLSRMLPPARRGFYQQVESATEDTLLWLQD